MSSKTAVSKPAPNPMRSHSESGLLLPAFRSPDDTSAAGRRSLNARKHGLTARNFVFSPEEAVAYDSHVAALLRHYVPLGPIEEALVRQIADGIWRLDRASAIEHGIFAAALESLPSDAAETDRALAPARTWIAEGKNLALLSLYVKRIENKLDANKAELLLLQNNRADDAQAKAQFEARAKSHREIVAAEPPANPVASLSRPYDPFDPAPLLAPPSLPDEFVFSTRLLASQSNRRVLAESARTIRKEAA